MKQHVRVAVGSTNGVKIEAARRAFEPFFDADVTGVEVKSGVKAQPMGDEAFEGAKNRANGAMRLSKSDFAVGIEGGIMELADRRFAFAAISVVDAKGHASASTTGLFQLPIESLKLVDEGFELGDAIDRVTGLPGVKHGPGAVGILSRGVIDRTALYAHGTTLALIPHLNRQFTWEGGGPHLLPTSLG